MVAAAAATVAAAAAATVAAAAAAVNDDRLALRGAYGQPHPLMYVCSDATDAAVAARIATLVLHPTIHPMLCFFCTTTQHPSSTPS
jgi:hypothetical protein